MTFWLLTIAGVSASGKTTLMDYLARGVHKRFGYYPTCVSMDGYYRNFSALAPHELQQVNYDHPDSFDVTALIRDLRYLKAGKPIYPRSYDYVQHKPVEAVTLTEAKPVLVLEGILPLHFTEILSLSDLTVYIDTPINDCYARRLRRDTLERGRSEESIRYQFETHVMPMYNAYIQPQKERADRVLADGGKCPILLQDIVEKVATCRD